MTEEQQSFIEFVLEQYVEVGVEMLSQDVLAELIRIRYNTVNDAKALLGGVDSIREMFLGFQRSLYESLAV